jgi:adenylate kinase
MATGDILRQAIADGSALGKSAQESVKAGQLVPDETVLGLIETRLRLTDAQHGFILDGFPRTLAQAQGLKLLLGDRRIDRALNLVVSAEVVITRLKDRWLCGTCDAIYNTVSLPPKVVGKCEQCGSDLRQRIDDQPDTVRKRLEVYARESAPLVTYYEREGVLRNVDATGPAVEVYAAIQRAIAKAA